MTKTSPALAVLCGVALTAGCFSGCAAKPAAIHAPAKSPAFSDLGDHTWRVSTRDELAQRHFDQGLVWMYSFNHDEAIRHFEWATAIDPNFAMAWWGVALSNGPHINNPFMDEPRSRAAWEALAKARSLESSATPVEQALIAALAARYADPAAGPLPFDPAARRPLDEAYARAMEQVHARFPGHPEVATLYAESLMDLMPWDLWSLDGKPRPQTPMVLATLEGVLRSNPNHPGANHLYIHAVEAGPTPQRADEAATRLRTLVPASGHMVHMPSHIDVRLGRWNLAADQNERAMRVHDRYQRTAPRPAFYRVYMFHNEHFLSYACMMAGRKADAIAAARGVRTSIPEDYYKDYAMIADAYLAIEVEALIRFGEWDAILREPEPRADLPITRCFWRFARGVAHAAKGDVRAARAEQQRFRAQVAALPEGAMMAINPAAKVLSIADNMLEGEIRYREGDIDGAVAHLRKAIEVEDTLMYMEPPDWVQPVRHALGAILLDAGKAAEAEAVYREDLRRWPENGWALFGLSESLKAQGRAQEAAEARARHAKAFARADITPKASCLCVRK